jgi:alkanesulfonate monooxygenase
MPVPHFHWFNPPKNDNRDLVAPPGKERIVTQEYRADVARAAERNHFESILFMTGQAVQDPWVSAASLVNLTSRIKFIVAVRPGFVLPTLVAQQAATFQEASGNRLYLNIVTGSHEPELRGYGDNLAKEARYARTAEFFQVLRGCWSGAPFSFEGEHYRIENGGLPEPLRVLPKLFMGGSSPSAREIAAKHAEIHLAYGEPPPLVREHVERGKELADKQGRKLEFGIRIQVIARPTSAEAWREADRLLAGLDPAVIERQQRNIRSRASVGQARVQALNTGRKEDPESLKIYPTMWSGTGLVGGGGGSTALVGSYEEIAERIDEYLSVGVEHFLVSGHPLLESAYEFGEGVLPLFRNRAERSADSLPSAAVAV